MIPWGYNDNQEDSCSGEDESKISIYQNSMIKWSKIMWIKSKQKMQFGNGQSL